MSLTITSLESLDTAEVDNAFNYLVTLVEEKYPDLETRRGVIGNLAMRLQSELAEVINENVRRLERSMSLLEISNDPTLADADIVDSRLSNYRVVRKDPSYASGEITIVLDRLVSVTIPAGATFTANGLSYAANAAYTARTSEATVLTDTDRLIEQIATDRYAFTINVTAVESGPAGQAVKDDKFVPDIPPIGFVQSYAVQDFTAAVGLETNQQLLDRLEDGAATRAVSNRVTTASMLRHAYESGHPLAKPGFADIVAISSIGCSNPEMQRDQHSLLPISSGSRMDMYLRVTPRLSRKSLTIAASLVDTVAAGGVFQFSLGRDKAPGFYTVESIRRVDDDPAIGGFVPDSTIRGYDITGEVYLPDIVSAQEATFSRYQTATFRFTDTLTDVSAMALGEAANYEVTVTYQPLIAEIQDYMGDYSVTPPVSDVLVKAAIPCVLSVSFKLYRKRTTASIDTSAIQAAVASAVNNTGFIGTLYAADLVQKITELLPDRVSIGEIDLFGRIFCPDGKIRYVRDSEAIAIPDVPEAYLSGRTAVFFLDPENVAITSVNADVPEL